MKLLMTGLKPRSSGDRSDRFDHFSKTHVCNKTTVADYKTAYTTTID